MHLKDLGNLNKIINEFNTKGKLDGANFFELLDKPTQAFILNSEKLNESQLKAIKTNVKWVDGVNGVRTTLSDLTEDEVDAAIKGALFSASQKEAAGSTGIFATSLEGLSYAMRTNPLFTAAAVVGSIYLVIKGIDYLASSTKRAKETALDSADAYKETAEALKSLHDELKTSQARIKELEALPSLSFIEQEELDKLKEATTELERQVAAKEKLAKHELAESREDTLKYFNKKETYETYLGLEDLPAEYGQSPYKIQDYENVQYAPLDMLDYQLDKYESLIQRKNDLNEKLLAIEKKGEEGYESSQEYANLRTDLSGVEGELNKLDGIIPNAILNLQSLDDSLDPKKDNTFIEKINTLYNAYDLLFGSAQSVTDKFNSVWDSDEFASKKAELLELGKAGKVTPEILESNENYKTLLDETGATAEQVASHINRLTEEEREAAKAQASLSFEGLLSSLPIDKLEELIALFKSGTIDENTISSYDDLNAIIQATGLSAEEAVKALKEFSDDYTLSSQLISDMDSTITLVAKLKDELEQTGTLGVDSLSALAKQFPELEYAVSQFNQGLISTDDLIALLQTAYENDADAFRTAMSLKLSGNETFFETIKRNNQTFFDNLAKAYDLDVGNWKTLAQAKAQIDQELIKNLSAAWSKYYNIVYDATGIASLEGGTDYSKIGTQDPTYDYNPEVQQAWYKANEQVKQYNKYIEQLNELANIEIDVSSFGGIEPSGYKGSGSSKDKKAKDPTIFDWIAVAAEQSEKKIEQLQNKLNDTSGWKPKNAITDTTIDEMANKLTSLQAMADSYQKAADSYDLSPTYIDKIKNGTLEIESVTDEVIAKNIKNYQEWYDKAEEMRKQIDETKRSMKELAQSKLDNIINDFNSLTSLMGKFVDYRNSLFELKDSLGESVTDSDYHDLIDRQEAIYNQLQSKYHTLNAELKNAVDNGAIEVGSEEWRKYNEELIDVNSSMKDAVSSMNEFRQSILNLSFKELDVFADKIDRINQGTNTLLNMLGEDGLMEDGMLTSKGLAQLALYGQQYTNAKQQAAEYANAIDALNDMYREGSITETEYNERLNEYTSAQLSAVEATKAAEQAILQFRYDAIQAQIDDMNKLIDAKKKALQAEKEYQDYIESVTDKQNDVNNLQKKIDELALSSDRRDIAQRLELEKQLSDAKKELSDLEADYSYNQTIEGLDKEAEEYEEAKNKELKELKESYEKQQEVIKKYLSQVKDNYETVYKTLTDYGIKYNVSMTDELTNPWSSADNAVNSFTDAVSDAVSQINIEISNIDLSRLTELIDMINEFSDASRGMSGSGGANYEDATGRGSWKKAADGKRWWYGNSDDDYVSDGIYTIKGKQFGFDENGYMQTEWQKHDGDYYYFDANNGHMVKSQWIPGNDGKQYYLTADGRMASDMAIKDKNDNEKYYYVDEDGVWDGETIGYDEVKERNLKVGYKNGTKNATPGWHPINEDGFEYVLTKEGSFASFGGGEKVFSNEMSNKLWELAANPAQFIMAANKANLGNMRLDKNATYPPVEITGPLVVVEGVMDEKMIGQVENMMNKWATKKLPDIMRKDMKGR